MSSVGRDAGPIVIVGGGLAGLFCALKLGTRPVVVIAAAPIGEGASSAWAQGGIAAAMGDGDTFEKHLADTIEAGAGIVDATIAEGMIREGPDRVHDLLSFGVPFDRDLEGRLNLSREAAHSERRIVRVNGDMAGRAIMEALIARVRQTPSIELREGETATDLLMDKGCVVGLTIQAADGASYDLPAAAVVLASGGAGHLFAITTNPAEAGARGLGMAARAGAAIADPEFVQFHPTALDVGLDPAPLATEALRGEGATLVDRAGERFMLGIHPDAELAPRDVVARAVFAKVVAGEGAFLDARAAIGDSFEARFPTVYRSCMRAGIDPARQPIPIAPAVHYHMGGVLTDARGRTSLDGLYACGEVASTGVHGANRLASNSLLEAVVFAARVAQDLESVAAGAAPARVETKASARQDPSAPAGDDVVMERLRATMTRHVGVVRTGEGMAAALAEIASLRETAGADTHRNELAAALVIAASAFRRTESRGGHYRSDFADERTDWQHRTVTTMDEAEATLGAILTECAKAEIA